MENGGAVLRKMIDQVGAQDTPILSLAVDALNIALGKVVRQAFDCDAVLKDGEVVPASLKTMLAAAPQPGLLVIVKAGTAKGILTLDGMLINGLVELMAGASDRAVYRQARTPTLIDISLCRDFCDGLLAELPRKLTGLAGHNSICELIWQEPEIEASRLTFALENTPLTGVKGKVELQNGLRGGEISVFLPMQVWQGDGCQRTNTVDPGWSRNLKKSVLAAPIPLRANLEKVELSLAQVMALKTGDTLEVSAYALSDLELVSAQGKPLLKGRLGQENGKKAIAIDAVYDALPDPVATLQSNDAPETADIGISGNAPISQIDEP
jgi:flagellar motor switch protein FliM